MKRRDNPKPEGPRTPNYPDLPEGLRQSDIPARVAARKEVERADVSIATLVAANPWIGIRRLALRMLFMVCTDRTPPQIAEMVDSPNPAKGDGYLRSWSEWVGEYPAGHKVETVDRGCMLGSMVRKIASACELPRLGLQDYDNEQLATIRSRMERDLSEMEQKNPERAAQDRWFPMGWSE